MWIGDWGLGVGGWGIGPTPNSQIPNPQSPIPINCEKILKSQRILKNKNINYFICRNKQFQKKFIYKVLKKTKT